MKNKTPRETGLKMVEKGFITQEKFDEMVKEHKDLQKKRNDLAIMDTQVGENSSSKMNTMGEDFEEEYRYTMYVNMMLTVLGTTMLYYIFFKWNK